MSSKPKPVPLAKSKEFQKFKANLLSAKRVLISTHMLPDGDGLGTEIALFHYLKRARKACRVYNPDPLPKRYRFLDSKAQILLGPGEVELWDTCDLWVIVDTNDPKRLGKVWQEMSLRAKKIVFLDHHPETLDTNGQSLSYPPHASVVSDPDSSSIGELLYRIFAELNLAKINKDVGQGLYVSVMTDTNSFRYARTTPLAHRIAGEMIELGVNPEEIYQSIYSSKEPIHLKLLGQLLQDIKISPNGKFAWFQIPLSLRRQHQATADDVQSFMNLLLLLRDAEIIGAFREEDAGQIRVSLKSKGRYVVNRLAMELGGGGHEFAAGCAISSSMDQTVTDVVKKIEQAIVAQTKIPLKGASLI